MNFALMMMNFVLQRMDLHLDDDFNANIKAAATGQERFDVVLVDGRCRCDLAPFSLTKVLGSCSGVTCHDLFRGECAIAALPFVDERSFVIIHDWSLVSLFPPSSFSPFPLDFPVL